MIVEIASYIATVLGTLTAVYVGHKLTASREKKSRKHAFALCQVEEFYSPLVGIRNEIRAKSELRARISPRLSQAAGPLSRHFPYSGSARAGSFWLLYILSPLNRNARRTDSSAALHLTALAAARSGLD